MNDKYIKHRQPLRAKAEACIARAPEIEQPAAQELLHELQVHQIELEMQHEELCQAQTALEASRDRYLRLYDFAPVGYITLAEDESIIEANLTCAKLLGVDRTKLINRRFAHFVAAEDSDRWHRYYRQAMQQGGKQSVELALRHTGGAVWHAQLDCRPMETLHSPVLMGITLTDITERKRADQALRIAAVAFETQAGILVTDADKTTLRVNRAFSRITGYSAEAACGRKPSFLHSGLHNEDFYRAIWASVKHHGYWQGEIWDKGKNGEVFPLWSTIAAVADDEGHITHYVGSFTEITAQKQAEKILFDTRDRLENQVAHTQMELEKFKQESALVNTALDVLLKYRETDKSEAQNQLSHEIERTVIPFLTRLKGAAIDENQGRLIDILEINLRHLVKSYGRAENLPAVYQQLTPVEIQVASLVRQGLATKLIAKTLNLSPGTVSIHRKHIRKKLELKGKASNLHSYLLSLYE
ncbi:PAS domain S-box protein [Candidatus Methylospira mobilis]|uniref:PAS domain S-box protein n=1 Tax=Candidatus Methylospira mobilis TaxID=1808979 RepID=UPI0028E6B17F|nr:PAS domain S-box protein [Candidatus Methylospira mobilis]WNV03265.1 PAS domain S-box protein [Candidatus Methylospira mobilis]